MTNETWNVSITLADNGSAVTARAELNDGSIDVIGRGVVSAEHDETSGEPAYALAALRSLESLSDALSYVVDTDRFVGADQA